MSMKELTADVVKCRIAKGFITPKFDGNKDLLLGKLMALVTEIAEMAEAIRRNDFENFKEEIADAHIRLLDIGGTSGVDAEEEIKKKMKVNWTRPYLHGQFTHS